MANTIGFIGLGRMGGAIAGNLLKAGYGLRVYNRTAEKAASLAAQGAQVVSQPSHTAEPGGIVITMLANDQALESVALDDQSFEKRLRPNGLHISMGTISPNLARRLADHHEQHAVEYVAAPVFGRPEAAVERKLWVCLSGPEAAKQRARPILDAVGQSLFDFGVRAEAAYVVKLAGNFLLESAIEALAEALTLGEKNGIDPTRLADMLGSTLFACPAYQTYGRAIAQKRYRPAGFTVALGLKDIDLVLGTAAGSAAPLPFASLLHDRFLAAIAKGRADLDWAAIALGVAEDAGLPADIAAEN